MLKLDLYRVLFLFLPLLKVGGCMGTPENEPNEESASLSLKNSDVAEPVADGLNWVFDRDGNVPDNAIIGGWEPDRILYVCRSWYKDGIHPGKIVDQNCNIGWGGEEIRLNPYEVLTGDSRHISWIDGSLGTAPRGAFCGGSEPGRPCLYVCRVNYNGLQPGKIVGENCNIGYGGKELTFPNYQVLVPLLG